MPLRYGLILNHMTDDPEDYKAVVSDNDTVTSEQLIEQMIGRGSTVTKAEALAVIEEYFQAIILNIQQGNNINTEFFKIYPSISGVFSAESDSFDATRHTIRLNLNAGARLTKSVLHIELKKVKRAAKLPLLQQFTDLKSNVVNASFTPGQIASLHGSLLKFDLNDINQGIFFIPLNGNPVIRIERILKNKPSELLFFVPDKMAAGKYQVEVRTIFQHSPKVRTGRLKYELVAST